jgi:hypothetical protein
MTEPEAHALLIKLNQLQSIVEQPHLFVTDYLSALRNQIDLEFVSLLQSESLHSTYLSFIDRVNSFEKQCLESSTLLETKGQMNQWIEKLKLKINTRKFDMDYLIDKTQLKMEAKLFNNKSLVYLNRNHLLLCIENYYIGLKSVHRLK